MMLRPADIAAHLERGERLPVYVIHGDEPLLALEAAELLRAGAKLAGFSEREVMTVEPGFKWSALSEAAQSISLFADQKLIELRIPSGKPGNEGGEALQHYAAHAPAENILLVQLPKLEKAQTQSQWFLALDKVGAVVACQALDHHDLPRWIDERLRRQQQRLAPDAMTWLVSRVEGNLLAAKQEIDKLALLHPAGELSLADLQAEITSVARYDVWSLGDALLVGDAGRLLRMLAGLRAEGEAAVVVLTALVSEIRGLLRVGLGQARNQSTQQLYRDNKVWGDKQRLYPQALKRLKASTLRAALMHAAEIDRISKGVGSGDVWEELEKLVLRLMPATAQRS